MKPHLTDKDYGIFKKYLSNSKYYFEYGSGGSTYEASMFSNIECVYSVESDKEWVKKIKLILPNNSKTTFFFVDLQSNGNWGNPGKDCKVSDYKQYSDAIHLVDKSKIDTVLIDGRFRVACALKCLELSNAVILFDDFLDRPKYHIVLEYYDIIEKGDRLVCLKRKSSINPHSQILIKKYEIIPD
jgi:protein O-GlcNAc transferase